MANMMDSIKANAEKPQKSAGAGASARQAACFTDETGINYARMMVEAGINAGDIEPCAIAVLQDVKRLDGSYGYRLQLTAEDGTTYDVCKLMMPNAIQEKMDKERAEAAEKAEKAAEKEAAKSASTKATGTALECIRWIADGLEDESLAQTLKDAYAIIADYGKVLHDMKRAEPIEALKRFNEKRYAETHAVPVVGDVEDTTN